MTPVLDSNTILNTVISRKTPPMLRNVLVHCSTPNTSRVRKLLCYLIPKHVSLRTDSNANTATTTMAVTTSSSSNQTSLLLRLRRTVKMSPCKIRCGPTTQYKLPRHWSPPPLPNRACVASAGYQGSILVLCRPNPKNAVPQIKEELP